VKISVQFREARPLDNKTVPCVGELNPAQALIHKIEETPLVYANADTEE